MLPRCKLHHGFFRNTHWVDFVKKKERRIWNSFDFARGVSEFLQVDTWAVQLSKLNRFHSPQLLLPTGIQRNNGSHESLGWNYKLKRPSTKAPNAPNKIIDGVIFDTSIFEHDKTSWFYIIVGILTTYFFLFVKDLLSLIWLRLCSPYPVKEVRSSMDSPASLMRHT